MSPNQKNIVNAIAKGMGADKEAKAAAIYHVKFFDDFLHVLFDGISTTIDDEKSDIKNSDMDESLINVITSAIAITAISTCQSTKANFLAAEATSE